MEIKKREGWRIISEEENERESFRGFGFSFSHFLSKGNQERGIIGEWGFVFFVKQGKSTVRERLRLRVGFHRGRVRLGCRGPP